MTKSEANDEQPDSEPEIENEPEELPITPYGLFNLGLNLSYTRLASIKNWSVGDREEYIVSALYKVENMISLSDIDTSIDEEMKSTRKYLEDSYDPADKINEDDGDELYDNCNNWISVLQDQVEKLNRIPVSSVGLLDYSTALENPEQLMEEEAWDWLSERSQEDLREACRALAVKCPTATVMLSLRALEDCIREWHKEAVGELESNTWGGVVKNLKSEYGFEDDGPVGPAIFYNLDYLQTKRNEVDHPDKRPEIHEANTTLMMVSGTIVEVLDKVNEVEGS